MTRYKKIENLSDEKFRRLTGVKKRTFNKMLEVLKPADYESKRKGKSYFL